MLTSCTSEKDKDNVENNTITPSDIDKDKYNAQWRESLDSSLMFLQLFGEGIDDKSMQDLILLAKEKGLGFKTAANSCFNAKAGDIPVETCKAYAESILAGDWSIEYNTSVIEGKNTLNVTKLTTFLYRSLKSDHPDLSEKILKNYLDDINAIKIPQNKAMAKINIGSMMYLSGIDDTKNMVLEGKQEYLDIIFNSGKDAFPAEVLNLTVPLACVDFEEAWDFVQKLIQDDFIQVEGKAAMSAGLMKTKYELGRQYFSEALDEIHKFEMPKQSVNHTAFEYAFSQLNGKDQAELLPEYYKAMSIYGRLDLMPKMDAEQLILAEPKVSTEYLDALYNWFKSNENIEKRLDTFHSALTTHCTRFMKSSNTPIFLGWALEWIDQLKDPYKKFIYLGRFITIQNGLIPNNFAVAKPKIQKIVNSIEGNLTKLDVRDSLFEIVIFKNPKDLKKLIGDGKSLLESPDLMFGMSHSLHYRHYMYPDDDAGLSDLFQDNFSQMELPEGTAELDRGIDIVLNLSGWNDEKAWEKFTLMDSNDGQYPLKIVTLANMIRHFDPDFSQRIIDDLMEKFRKNYFDLTNPTLEKDVTGNLTFGNLDWAIQFAEIIAEKRGNKPPVLSWYTNAMEIFKTISKTKTEGPQIAELSTEMYKNISEDLKKVEKAPITETEDSKKMKEDSKTK